MAIIKTLQFTRRSVLGLMAGLAISWPTMALEFEGNLVQGGLLFGDAEPGSQVWLNDRPVRVTGDGRFVLGFGRDAEPNQQVRIAAPGGNEQVRELTLAQRDYDIQRVNGVPSRTVTPSEEHLARIRREAARVRDVRATDSDLRGFLQPFIWPAEGRISGVYGSQRVYNGEPRSPHYGVDIAAPKGSPVIAPAAGMVTMAEPDLFYSGGTLIIDHGYGVSSTFLHLDGFEVEPGQRIEQGDVIGRVGSTGRSTGPHLDWRINWYGVRVDPTTVAPAIVSGHTPGSDK
ncbi:M23 family metallopeptidase [Marinobacter changyiensis]|uniref:M23 family metallopeptidase n=1 Tax=Marinobacter changyiensis TaxID=2604091 RepID=UPI0012651944|nr:M23 family metallopeptidase [Marinobacter changyiensis]